MGTHTKGPWQVGEDDPNGQAIVMGPHHEIATCWHHCVGSIEKEMRANARLIAAAPDLDDASCAALIAIEATLKYENLSKAIRRDLEGARGKLRAAIDKASPTPTGERR